MSLKPGYGKSILQCLCTVGFRIDLKFTNNVFENTFSIKVSA